MQLLLQERPPNLNLKVKVALFLRPNARSLRAARRLGVPLPGMHAQTAPAGCVQMESGRRLARGVVAESNGNVPVANADNQALKGRRCGWRAASSLAR